MAKRWFAGWWMRHLSTQVAADCEALVRGPGIHWHRVGPREHVVYFIR